MMQKIIVTLILFLMILGTLNAFEDTVNRNVNSSLINDISAPIIIAEKYVERPICAQVITSAISPEGECKEFPTPCDVPEGWERVEECPKEIVPEKQEEIASKAIVMASSIIISILTVLLLSLLALYMRKHKGKKRRSHKI